MGAATAARLLPLLPLVSGAAVRCPRFNGTVCAGHGTCNAAGICECEAGYARADCSVADFCPKDCSGHGTCKRRARGRSASELDTPGTCMCDATRAGVACDEYIPHLQCEALSFCSGHGECVCTPSAPRTRIEERLVRLGLLGEARLDRRHVGDRRVELDRRLLDASLVLVVDVEVRGVRARGARHLCSLRLVDQGDARGTQVCVRVCWSIPTLPTTLIRGLKPWRPPKWWPHGDRKKAPIARHFRPSPGSFTWRPPRRRQKASAMNMARMQAKRKSAAKRGRRTDLRFRPSAINADASSFKRLVKKCAEHAGRTTILPKDVRLARHLRG